MTLPEFLACHAEVARVRVARVRGSAPREAGAEMLVAPGALWGTIGGGQLEYMGLDRARAMLASGEARMEMDVPLGPEIGQCCGGRVALDVERLDAAGRAAALARDAERRAARPHALVLGAGHVGRALAGFLTRLPVRAVLIDEREDELERCEAPVERRRTALPEAEIRAAPPGSAFVVLTHDHALDFLLASEALARGDAAYVGMIGSATKRAKLASFLREREGAPSIAGLTCPIGAMGSADKRPEVIAAFAAAEIIAALTRGVSSAPAKDAPSPRRSTLAREAAAGSGCEDRSAGQS